MSGKTTRPPILKMLLHVVAGFVFVGATHVAIWLFLGVVAGNAASTVIQMTGFYIAFIRPTLIYMRWKDEAKEQSRE